jgi:hypothetical protein
MAIHVRGETSEGKRSLGKPRHTWDNDINVNLKEMGLEDVEGSVMGYREHSTELVGSMVGREFLK